jgi:DnaK suppressor protein
MTQPISPDLLARATELLDRREAELRAAMAADTDVAAHAHDRTEVVDSKDAAGEDAQAVVDDAFAARAAHELAAIAAARRRMTGGSYGTCTSCGEAIAGQRLLALPSAPLCARCQAQTE